MEPRPLRFGGTTVRVTDDLTVTTLPDGAVVDAGPHWDSPDYKATALRLGYDTNRRGLHRMCREHEAAHSAICHLIGLPESPTLRGVARGEPASPLTDLEEAAVLALQAFANAAGVHLLEALARRAERDASHAGEP